MLVRIVPGSTLPGHRSASASAIARARAWSSASRSTIVSSATMPAAAITPAWRMPPPSLRRCTRASAITSAGPHNSEPTGAPSPFERQNITVSAPPMSALGAVPVAMAAFQMRAPSTCTRNPRSCARSTSVRISSAPVGAPDITMYEFSRVSIEIGGNSYCAPSHAVTMPSGTSHNGCSCTPLFCAVAASSYWYTCERDGHSASVPGRAITRNASWFAIVPDGVYSAAWVPSTAAASDCRRLTVGSSPYSSSPTSASAIARRISGVGVVNVSLRSSTMLMRPTSGPRTPGTRASTVRASGSAPGSFRLHGPNQAFLHHRDRERAVVPVDEPFGEPARALRRRTLLVVQQPLVGRERAVEPHRVVEARDHEAVVVPRARMRHPRGVEQREVGRVRHDARVHQRVVGKLPVRTEPHELLGLTIDRRGAQPAGQVGRALVDRPLAADPLLEVRREAVGIRLEPLLERRQRLRIGCRGHRVLVLGPGFGHLERRGEVEDRAAVLDR